MKYSFLRSVAPALAGAFLLSTMTLVQAQVVTTGIVIGADPGTGLVTLRSDQNNRLINLRGMDRVKVVRSSGTPAKLDDVWTGMRVTVFYAQRGNQWYVGSLAIPDPPPPTPSNDWIWLLTPGERQALYSDATHSHDMTRRPGSRAFTDNDITIKPPRRALFDNDITIRNDNR